MITLGSMMTTEAPHGIGIPPANVVHRVHHYRDKRVEWLTDSNGWPTGYMLVDVHCMDPKWGKS